MCAEDLAAAGPGVKGQPRAKGQEHFKQITEPPVALPCPGLSWGVQVGCSLPGVPPPGALSRSPGFVLHSALQCRVPVSSEKQFLLELFLLCFLSQWCDPRPRRSPLPRRAPRRTSQRPPQPAPGRNTQQRASAQTPHSSGRSHPTFRMRVAAQDRSVGPHTQALVRVGGGLVVKALPLCHPGSLPSLPYLG